MKLARRLIPALIVVLTAVSVFADETADRAAANKAALEKLQGRWKVATIVKRGQDVGEIAKLGLLFTFKDDLLTVTADAPGFTPQHRVMRIDANATPMLMDFAETTKAFDEHKDVVEGVYALDGDTLQWCFNLDGDQPAKANRPAAVGSTAESSALLIKLERVKE